MINKVSAIGVLCTVGALSFSIGAQAQEQAREVAIFQIELVTQLDTTIEGGAFDMTGPVDRRLVKHVADCVEVVRTVATNWAIKQQLVVGREERRKSSLILHLERPKQRGVYEILYHVNTSQGYATGSFKYYDATGTLLSDPTSGYREFRTQLGEAMLCQ